MKKVRRKNSLQTNINITPLVDVMLVLLIVFMVCAPMMRSGVDLSLPKTQAQSAKTPPNNITVSMDKKGAIFVEKESVSEKNLVQMLTRLFQKNPSLSCLVCADAQLDYQRILSLLALIAKAGIDRVSLVSESKN